MSRQPPDFNLLDVRPHRGSQHHGFEVSRQAWQQALTPPLNGLAQRVRPNVLLTGEQGEPLAPFVEELLTQAEAGALTLRRTGPCVRCLMTTMDPGTGEPQPPALDALTRLSAERAPGEPVQFGVYVAGTGAGVLRVGDPLALTLNF